MMSVFQRPRRFRRRFVLFMLLSLVPAVVALLVAGALQKRHAIEDARRFARQYVQLTTLELQQEVHAMRDLLTAISVSPLLVPDGDVDCRTLFGRLLRDRPDIVNLGLVGLDGRIVCSLQEHDPDIRVSDRDYFRNALKTGELVSSHYLVGRISGEGVVVFARPVLGAFGDPAGVAFVATRFHGLAQVAQHTDLSVEDDLLLVLDGAGTVVGRFPDDGSWRGRQHADHALVQAMLGSGSGEGEFVSLDGRPRRFVFQALEVSGVPAFHVAIGMDESHLLSDARKFFLMGLLAALLVTALSVSVLWFGFGRGTGRQLDRIVAAANRLAAGEEAVRLETGRAAHSRDDEFDMIAQAFNALSDALEQRRHDWQQALQEAGTANRMTTSILDSLSARIQVLDRTGRVIACNAACQGEALRNGQGVGDNYLQLIEQAGFLDAQVRQSMSSALHTLLNTPGRPCLAPDRHCPNPCAVIEYRRMDEEESESRWYEMRVTPLRREEGGLVVAHEDITERKRLSIRLEEMFEQVERSNRELQDFAYIASHDLQEPLRKVIAFADRIESQYAPVLDERGLDYLARMSGAARRMQVLIDDLLAMSRVTTRAAPMQRLDLGEITAQVLVDLDERLRESGGRVRVGPLPEVEADPTQMRQLMQNLIGNALKFVAPGQSPEVEVCTEEAPGGWVTLCVQDRGIGLDDEDGARIFSPFVRLQGRGAFPGSGLGLAVVKRIVDRHGGRVWAGARPGGGACFRVSLPVAQPPAAAGLDSVPETTVRSGCMP